MSASQVSITARVPRWQAIFYASGSLSVALSYQAFATYIQFLYIDIFGLRAAWVGIIWSIYGIWNAINDPLAGFWSDRTRTSWGRRIPWIAAFFLPLSIVFYFLWAPPFSLVEGPSRSLLTYFFVIVLVFDLLWTIVVMNWTSLFPEMISDEKQRASVSGWRQVFSLFGLLVGVGLPPVLAGADWGGRDEMALLLATVTAIFFGLSLLGSRERHEFRKDEPLSLRQALSVTLQNRNFLYFLAANLAVQFVFMMLTATVPFYAKYVLRIQGPLTISFLNLTLDAGTQTSLFTAAAFLTALPAMGLWTMIAQRWGAWRALRISCVASAAILLLLFFPTDFYSGLLVTAIFGLSFAGLLMLTDLLIADVVDADELETGTRREGMFFGMNGFVIRFAFTIQGIITGTVLTLTGYIAANDAVLFPEQPASALMGIRLMIGGIPALASILAFIILSGYRLRGPELEAVRQEVAALHARKEAGV